MFYFKKILLVLLMTAIITVSSFMPHIVHAVYTDSMNVKDNEKVEQLGLPKTVADKKTILISTKKPLLPPDLKAELEEGVLKPTVLGSSHKIPINAVNVTDFTIEEGFNGWKLSEKGKNIDMTGAIISISYDEGKIPVSCTEDNVFIFYYDETAGVWRLLKRAFIDVLNNVVGGIPSTSTPFSHTSGTAQFFAAAVNIETEPAQTKGINTIPLNMPEVNPMSGIKTILPPTPNNKGTASFSYPINLPAGMNGLTPGVSINYSNDLKYGNCGVGWNIGVSSIQIKTRNQGVPEYDGKDTMLLDGKKLECVLKGTINSGGEFGIKTYDKEYRLFNVHQQYRLAIFYRGSCKIWNTWTYTFFSREFPDRLHRY